MLVTLTGMVGAEVRLEQLRKVLDMSVTLAGILGASARLEQ